MNTKICAAIFCAAAFALSSVAVTPADAQTQTRRSAAKKVAAKKYGPVPISMAPPPRARITVQRRTFLDAGTHVHPGRPQVHGLRDSAGLFAGQRDRQPRRDVHRSKPLPGPFTLPGRDNPWPWNSCVGC